MLEVGIKLAVAAVPEALPAVTTFILAFGGVRMAKQKAIVLMIYFSRNRDSALKHHVVR